MGSFRATGMTVRSRMGSKNVYVVHYGLDERKAFDRLEESTKFCMELIKRGVSHSVSKEITLATLKQEARKKDKSYHLFGDGWDEYFSVRKEAEQAYRESDAPNLRLYKEWSFEGDEEVQEEYIKGRGDFPW